MDIMHSIDPVDPRTGEVTISQIEAYTYEQIQTLLGIKDTALRDRIRTLGLTPEREGKTPLINWKQFMQLKAFNEHLKKGGSIATFKQLVKTAETTAQTKDLATCTVHSMQASHLPELTQKNAVMAIATNPRLQAYAHFDIYHDSNQTITDDEVEALIGFKPPRTGYTYDYYRFIRYGKIHVLKDAVLEKLATWKIEKLS